MRQITSYNASVISLIQLNIQVSSVAHFTIYIISKLILELEKYCLIGRLKPDFSTLLSFILLFKKGRSYLN